MLQCTGNMITTTCSICFRKFQSFPSQKREFCSMVCMYVWRGKRQTKLSLLRRVSKKCDICSRTFLVKTAHAKLRRTCSLVCSGLFRTLFLVGNRASRWEGGLTVINVGVRKLTMYRTWRLNIFKRDGFRCVLCRTKKGPFNADHYPVSFANLIRMFTIDSISKAVRCRGLWDLKLGRTLCVPCHKKTPNYLKRVTS